MQEIVGRTCLKLGAILVVVLTEIVRSFQCELLDLFKM